MKTGRLALAGLGLALMFAPVLAAKSPGADLAQRLGCFACHSRPDQGSGEAVSLANVGTRFSADQLKALLAHPRRYHPQARMPNYAHLRPHELQALIDYLLTLK